MQAVKRGDGSRPLKKSRTVLLSVYLSPKRTTTNIISISLLCPNCPWKSEKDNYKYRF